MEIYTFCDAISWITVNGMRASLTLNGVERTYYKNEDGAIMCIPNGKSNLEYVVNKFNIDAILSDDWKLLDD